MQPALACSIHRALSERLNEARKCYITAMQHLEELTPEQFGEASENLRRTRLLYQLARKRLFDHKAAHGC